VGLFDTHAHLTDPGLCQELDAVLARAAEAGVEWILSVSVDLETSRRSQEIAANRKNVLAAVGVHPESAGGVKPGWEAELEDVIARGGVAAIGECGLDGFHPDPPVEDQIPVLRAQVRLAKKHRLPLVLHSRKASWETLKVIEEEGALEAGGVFHCIADDEVFARAAVNAGFHLGVCGNVTYPRNDVFRALLGRMPKEKLLLETDSPYLAPQQVRGGRNEPAFIVHTARTLAEALGAGLGETASLTTANAARLFGVAKE